MIVDWNSPGISFTQEHVNEIHPDQEAKVSAVSSPWQIIRSGRRNLLAGSSNFRSRINTSVSKRLASGSALCRRRKIILDPQGSFLLRWNKIFLISCFLALAIDALCFYIPVIDDRTSKVTLDNTLEKFYSALRTFSDMFHFGHIIIEFHTGFICPSSTVLGRGEVIKDHGAIVRRYVTSYFIVDFLALLPLPQAFFLIVSLKGGDHAHSLKWFIPVIIFQNLLRSIRIYRLLKGVTKASGRIINSAGSGAAFNLFLYTFASHVIGGLWYLLAVQRVVVCNEKQRGSPSCQQIDTFTKARKGENVNGGHGIYNDALLHEVIKSKMHTGKLMYCIWWGMKNLSSLGQGLKTTMEIGETLFAACICISGLILFSLLIGDMKRYLQSHTVCVEEMRVKRQDAEQWMSHRSLPENLRQRIRRYEQYKWQETRGVDEENLVSTFPKDLRRDIKRHLCIALLIRVPLFQTMDEQLIDAMCILLKPVLYSEKSVIVQEGDPVNEMLFIMRGNLITMTTNGGRTGFCNSVHIQTGDFCGEELLTWALQPHSCSNLPISTRTVHTTTDVEALALSCDDLKFVASQFRRLHSKQLRHIIRVYSQQWRTWAACFIQAIWRRYCRGKLRTYLKESEDKLQTA